MSEQMTEQMSEQMTEQMSEEWQDLKNHSDYEICVQYPHQIRKRSTGRIIAEHLYPTGYLGCYLNRKNYYKHRLIAEQFIENPENLPQVDHINAIRSDNRIDNLRWVNISQNNRNKAGYNGRRVEYVDELPEDAIKIQMYRGIEFDNYFYSKSTQKCYFDNGIRIRVLPYHTSAYGLKYICARDVENINRTIYIKAWMREECIE